MSNNSRFTYYKKRTVNFEQASSLCKSDGRTLAKVDDIASWNDITAHQATEKDYGYWWLGASKNLTTNKYYWTDGEQFQSFSPSFPITGDKTGKRCLAVYNHASIKIIKLYSMPCNNHMYFICEKGNSVNTVIPSVTSETENLTSVSIFSDTEATNLDYEYVTALQTAPVDLQPAQGKDLGSIFPLDHTSDPGMWMFAALFLALLLIIALVIIIKLWVDKRRLRKLKMKHSLSETPTVVMEDLHLMAENEGKQQTISMSLIEEKLSDSDS